MAVTGSAGKTTTKDVIADMLSVEITTAKNEGNLNNHVGVPLSLLRLPEDARVAVIEIGMNHAGEIRDLAAIARPQIGVVTNVGYAHIEFFDSIDDIAAAKRELIEALPANRHGRSERRRRARRRVSFSRAERCCTASRPTRTFAPRMSNIRSKAFVSASAGTVFSSRAHRPAQCIEHSRRDRGRRLYGIEPGRLVEAVRKLSPGKMRGERFHHRGVLVYNDCYNSNPDAVRAMLDVLRDTPARRRIAVLGEMLELGRWAEPLHRDVGTYAAEQGIDVLVGIRGAACCTLDAATRAGLRAGAAFFFDDPAEAGRMLRHARPGRATRSCLKARAACTSSGRSKSFWLPDRKEAGTEPCSTGCFTKSCSISTRRSANFQYDTFRTAMASLTALLLSIVLGPWLIAPLRQFQIGQHIREDGPKSHQKKAGTPTMGGLLICVSIIVPTLLWANLATPAVWVALAGLVCFGAIGFWDDYTKLVRKRNLGLTGARKNRASDRRRPADRRAAADHELAQPVLHHHEHSVHEEFQARSADPLVAAEIRGRIRSRFCRLSRF